jgi:hypothetical protein
MGDPPPAELNPTPPFVPARLRYLTSPRCIDSKLCPRPLTIQSQVIAAWMDGAGVRPQTTTWANSCTCLAGSVATVLTSQPQLVGGAGLSPKPHLANCARGHAQGQIGDAQGSP